MIELSDEQKAIVDAPLAPMSVIACAGSGKTRTALHRVIEIRKRLGASRGRVALLSFSNIAVNTFKKDYQLLVQDIIAGFGQSRVDICTLDAFITGNILHPHAHRTMNAAKSAFLVNGNEPFLHSFKIWVDNNNRKMPISIDQVEVGLRGGNFYFYYKLYDKIIDINSHNALQVVESLAKTGAYTHSLGRYWALKALCDQPLILKALAHRYPHILVDESLDIGLMHKLLLQLLISAGVQISLIGDPHQGIYEFAGADGKFLTEYGEKDGVETFSLTKNYRSVSPILDIANNLSGRTNKAERSQPDTHHGAFFIGYNNQDSQKLIDAFLADVNRAGLTIENSAIVCRSRKLVEELGGGGSSIGQGLVSRFAEAAILRDQHHDYHSSFKIVTRCVVDLIEKPPEKLSMQILDTYRYPEMRAIRRKIWSYIRDEKIGLPSSMLVADKEWHKQLLSSVKVLLGCFNKEFGFEIVENIGNKISKKKLPNSPIFVPDDMLIQRGFNVRTNTVHQVKGESIDAVLYVATKEHINALISGVTEEDGRIGYVAVTRARNLLWVAFPVKLLPEMKPHLLAKGFKEIGAV